METKSEKAKQLFESGLNCGQSTILGFAPDYGLDEKDAMRIAAAFGGGCHYGEICGSVLAGCAVVGLKHGNTEPDPEKYGHCRERVREYLGVVLEQHGTLTCSGLLDMDMSAPDGIAKMREKGLRETRCTGIVGSIVDILVELGY